MDKYSICGYDCKKCPIYVATISNNLDAIRKHLFLGPNVNVTLDEYGCFGCLSDKSKNMMCKSCMIRSCANENKLNSCSDCQKFPCAYLNVISPESMENLKKIKGEK